MPTIHGEHETHYAVSDNMRNNHLEQETPQYTTIKQRSPLTLQFLPWKYYQKGPFLGQTYINDFVLEITCEPVATFQETNFYHFYRLEPKNSTTKQNHTQKNDPIFYSWLVK